MAITEPNEWLTLINLIVRIIIAVVLVYVAWKSKQKSFYILAASFLLLGISYIFSVDPEITFNHWQFSWLLPGYMASVIFIYLAFFQERKGAMMGLIVILTMMSIILIFVTYWDVLGSFLFPRDENFSLLTPEEQQMGSVARYARTFMYGLMVMIISSILVVALAEALLRIRKSKEVKSWIKGRYLAVLINKGIYIAVGVTIILPVTDPFNEVFNDINSSIQFTIILVAMFFDVLAWIVPTLVKSISARAGVIAPEEEMTEDEIMKELARGG